MTHLQLSIPSRIRRDRFVHRCLLYVCVGLTLMACGRATAQLQNTGVVLGNITDNSGAVVANAVVTLTSVERGQAITKATNTSGEFLFSSVAVGTYTITVQAPSFGTVVEKNVVVDADKNVRVDSKLVPTTVESTVTVEASGNTVDTQSATIGVLIDNNLVQNLPIDGNNVVELAALLPGVSNVNAPTTFTGDTSGPTYNVSGSRSTQNLFLLDGSLWNNLYTNSGLNFPPPDALQEISVLLNNFKAQYGRNVGSVFNAITKAGTNSFHGVVYEYLQNTALDAQDYILKMPSKLIQNQYGATLGGPIVRDKLFFFASYQGLRLAQTANNPNASTSFTAADRGLDANGNAVPCTANGYFPGNYCFNLNDVASVGGIHNPLSASNTTSPGVAISSFNAAYMQSGHTLAPGANSPCVNLLQNALLVNGTTIVNNELPDQCLNPVSFAIIQKYMPQPNASGNTTSSIPYPRDDQNGLIRVDYNLGHHHTLDARYYQTQAVDVITRGNLTTSVVSYEPDADFGTIHFGDLGDTWVLGPNLLNVFRAAYKRYDYQYHPTDPTTLASLGANFPNYNTVPVLPAFPALGSASQAISSSVNEDVELVDTFSWQKGNHNFQFGADYLRLQYQNIAESAPAFSFGETYSLTFQGDELLGLPSQEVFSNSLNRSGIQHVDYFYVQDDWRITRKMTLNLGLRYELPLRYTQPKGQDTMFIPGYQSKIYPNAVPDLAFVGDPGIRPGIIKNEYTDIAPRIGFSYDVFGSGRTAIRGGFGIFYDASSALTIGVGEPFHYTATNLYPPGGVSNPLLGENPIPANFNGTNPQFATPFSIFFPDKNFRDGYTEAMNLGFQQSVSRGGVLEVNYVLRLGRHQALPIDENPAIYDCKGAYYQINPSLYCPQTQATAESTISYLARARYPGFNVGGQGVVDYNSIGTSNYNGLQILYQQHATRGLTVTSSFSYAKSMDESSLGTTTASSVPQVDNLKSEYGPSDYDTKFTVGIGWAFAPTRFNSNSRTMRTLLSGWTQSGIYNANTGKPFDVTLTTDDAYTDEVGSKQRAQLVPGQVGTLPSNRPRSAKVAEWFNTAAWIAPTPGTFSNQSRNDLRGPSYVMLNLSGGRSFGLPIMSTTRLVFRADAINAMNIPNFQNPNSSLPSTSGRFQEAVIQATTGPNANTIGSNARRLQLSLKLIY